jgi:hypothetical protein
MIVCENLIFSQIMLHNPVRLEELSDLETILELHGNYRFGIGYCVVELGGIDNIEFVGIQLYKLNSHDIKLYDGWIAKDKILVDLFIKQGQPAFHYKVSKNLVDKLLDHGMMPGANFIDFDRIIKLEYKWISAHFWDDYTAEQRETLHNLGFKFINKYSLRNCFKSDEHRDPAQIMYIHASFFTKK